MANDVHMADFDEDQALAMSIQLALLAEDDQLYNSSPFSRSGTRTPRSSRVQQDWAVARELFEEELKKVNQIETDRRLASSIRRAVAQDAELINLEVNHNQQFQSDLALARRLANSNTEIPVGIPLVPTNPPENMSARPKLGHFMEPRGLGTGMSSVVGHKTTGPADKIYCDVCTELKNDYDIVALSCEHSYCRTCLHQTFTHALKDPGSFPPRCCQVIPTTLAAEVLNDRDLESYLYESVLHDAGGKRVNCARVGCNQVLFPGWIREDVGLCMKCNCRTCIICRADAHEGDCPKDEDTISLFKLAGDKRWQRCPSCHSVVELTQGCFHMTCRCTYQFCYKCAAKWKTCSCVQADESYITGRPQINSATPTGSTFARIISTTRRVQLDIEHRQQAQRYDEGLKRRLEELKTLRKTREAQRDAVIMDRMVREQEKEVLDELKREESRKREEDTKKRTRERELGVLLRDKLININETIVGRGKGKGRSMDTSAPGGVESLVGKLVQATMSAESSISKGTKSHGSSIFGSRDSSSANNYKRPKRELSPATKNRMAGLS